MTLLFDDIVFGPVRSRRFGVSLGINLLPVDFKYCTFNCVYCECGWTFGQSSKKIKLPTREEVAHALELRLTGLSNQEITPDHITFAGNGEPTVHPAFDTIVQDVILLRDRYFPATAITVLSNASRIHLKSVFNALNLVDNNVLKLDSAVEETFRLINQPPASLHLSDLIENLKRFEGNQIIQTLFVRGTYKGKRLDNTTPSEVDALVQVIREIQPKYMMIYPIERDTPIQTLEKISPDELNQLAGKFESAGIATKVYE